MQLLLEKDPDSLNVTDDQGANALWYAVFTNNVEGLVLLLQQPSVDVNCCLRVDPETPLVYALHGGSGD